MWESLKAQLLEVGTAQLTGADASEYESKSTAGPGAGGRGSVFFSYEGHRVRLNVADNSPITLRHIGGGTVMLTYGYIEVLGKLEKPGSHCPGQAYITISGSCIYHCKYCPVPANAAPTKSMDEIVSLVQNADDIHAISLTSGVVGSTEEEENRALGAQLVGVDRVILVGETLVGVISEGYKEAGGDMEKLTVVHTLTDAQEELKGRLLAGDTVLFLNDLPDMYI